MQRFALLLLLPLFLTGCASVYVPPADYEEAETETVTETEPESAAEPEPETDAARRIPPKPQTTEESDEDETGEETEDETADETEPLVIPDWAEGYAALLRQKNAGSDHQDAYYAMIRLDADTTPELVIFDDTAMELYYFTDRAPALLLEDGYKSAAASGQNLCYQPETGRLASAFTTMGGGSGFNFFFYEELFPGQFERLCFNNNEDEGGEMPYNPLWDRAEEFDIHNNGWTDVSLGDSWTHIGTDFEDIHVLVPVTGQKLTVEWNHILEDIHEPDELVEDGEETE